MNLNNKFTPKLRQKWEESKFIFAIVDFVQIGKIFVNL